MLFFFIFIFIFMFFIGILGLFIVKKNFLIILLCIELMFLAINLNFIIVSLLIDDASAQMLSVIILGVAAAEAAIGLGLISIYYRIKQHNISLDFIKKLKN